MKLRFETREDLTLIRLDGAALDASTARQFRREVLHSVPANSRAILDLSGVTFVDSTGCGAILACVRHFRSEPQNRETGGLKVCSASRPVRVLFEMIRLHTIVDIYNDQDEAIRAYGAA